MVIPRQLMWAALGIGLAFGLIFLLVVPYDFDEACLTISQPTMNIATPT
jgi:hypothetical protein